MFFFTNNELEMKNSANAIKLQKPKRESILSEVIAIHLFQIIKRLH